MIAAVLFWTAPTVFVWLSTKERGFYGAMMVLGLTVVLMTLRLRDRASWRDAAVLGLAGGSGWYANPQVVYLVAPALGWLPIISLKGRRVDLLRLWWVAAAGGVVGALPWLGANLLPLSAVAGPGPDRREMHRWPRAPAWGRRNPRGCRSLGEWNGFTHDLEPESRTQPRFGGG